MATFFWILIYVTTFLFMEFMAWFSHKYIMHGFLWHLHKDHHKKDHGSWFERNDLFFIFYAIVSMSLVILWGEYGFWAGLPMALGMF
jgi:beta-carotene 3-hydroxylase